MIRAGGDSSVTSAWTGGEMFVIVVGGEMLKIMVGMVMLFVV